MSRHYYSPYATHRGPSRWPWVFVFVLLLVFAGAGSVVLARDSVERVIDVDRALERVGLADESDPAPDEPAALAQDDPSPTAKGENEPATAEASPEPDAGEDQPDPDAAALPNQDAEGEGEGAPATTVAQVDAEASPQATEVSEGEMAAASESPNGLVELFGALWAAGDYDGLYDLISTEAQGAVTREDFVARYQGISDEAGLTSVEMARTGESNLEAQVPIHVAMESRLVGPIEQDNTVQLVKEDDAWRVAWTPSLIFRNLDDGCIQFSGAEMRRGSILDRDGDELAYDGPVSQVVVVPGEITDEQKVLRELSELLDMPRDEIKAKYEGRAPDQFWVIKRIAEADTKALVDVLGELDGVRLQQTTGRVYPLGAKAAHITGYVTAVTAEDMEQDPAGKLGPDDLVGRAGIEAAADEMLRGVPGGDLQIVHCGSRNEREVIASKRAEPGKDLTLTVDIDLQEAVDAALGDVKGAAVVVDPRTGGVLAMASHPSFDPNWFVLGFSDDDWAYINDENERPLLNRATQAAYPTGSIFKVITASAAMTELGYTGQSEIECPRQWSVPGTSQVWRDWTDDEGLPAQGVLSLHNAIVQSCNTVFYQLGYELDQKDNELLPRMAREYGLGEPTGIPYLPEIAGTVPDPEWKLEVVGDYWATGDGVNLAIGQGFVEATPLQMAMVYATIANNGSLLRPYIVEFAKEPGGGSEIVGERKGRNSVDVSRENLREIQSALRDQTSNGFGAGSTRVFGDYLYPIAGKTGTAENQLDRSGKPHSWFASFGPYGERATITSIVMVENVGEGVSYAAPITKKIYDAYRETDLAAAVDSG
ncbi:MAG: penicillin-binding protein 2 [Thermomicrobiales bacterium]